MQSNLAPLLAPYGLTLTEQQQSSFDVYRAMLLDWNTRMNLTAITAPDEVDAKHFLDSLLLLRAVDLPQGASLIDVGTGAGFPAVPVHILRPDLQVTLLDSLQKRIGFLQSLSDALQQHNLLLHARAEDAAHSPRHREQYDMATARAVAALPVLCEYCLPFVKVGGVFAALKGSGGEQEARAAAKAIATLGGRLEDPVPFTLPDASARVIIPIRKISQTPSKYPRIPAKIAKAPLI